MGQARASAAVVSLLGAIPEIEEMERQAARAIPPAPTGITFPALGKEPFNLSDEEMRREWRRRHER